MQRPSGLLVIAGAVTLLLVSVVNVNAQSVQWRQLEVTASAFNTLPWQTTKTKPAIAAWGDTLKPGMRAIAVSRDLIRKGLTHGTRVKIEGLPGIYVVRDKMNRRFRKKIDIYMGKNIAAARAWGVQKDVRISFAEPAQ